MGVAEFGREAAPLKINLRYGNDFLVRHGCILSGGRRELIIDAHVDQQGTTYLDCPWDTLVRAAERVDRDRLCGCVDVGIRHRMGWYCKRWNFRGRLRWEEDWWFERSSDVCTIHDSEHPVTDMAVLRAPEFRT